MLSWGNFWKAVIFYFFTIIARFIAIGIFYPIFSEKNRGKKYGLNWKEYVVLSFGGLSGSHGLMLAMVIY